MASDEVREALIEFEEYANYSKYLLENKGVDMSIEKCYDMFHWFKDKTPDSIYKSNSTLWALWDIGHNIAIHWSGCTTQMDQLYELYYALKYGINKLNNMEV